MIREKKKKKMWPTNIILIEKASRKMLSDRDICLALQKKEIKFLPLAYLKLQGINFFYSCENIKATFFSSESLTFFWFRAISNLDRHVQAKKLK
jgi:hypothetical protein